jgi:hypothetical protein
MGGVKSRPLLSECYVSVLAAIFSTSRTGTAETNPDVFVPLMIDFAS